MTTDADLRSSLGQQVPFLRRYARALTGSQASGDAFVRMTLETILEEPSRLGSDGALRVALFRLFQAIWQTVAEPAAFDGVHTDADLHPALGEGLLQQLSLARREAFLLTALEGFSMAEAAAILDRPLETIRADIDAARQAITTGMASRIIIIEDEPVIALHLQDIVEDMGHTVVGIASTHREAVALNAKFGADLLLSDICLADGSSGLDAVSDILARSTIPVIFITAFPERLLTGTQPEPTYLITKPFDVDAVIVTVGQALLLSNAPPVTTAVAPAAQQARM